MCSFIGTNKKIDDLEKINRFTKNRGPDGTTTTTHGGINLVHNLLSITGDFKTQPLVSDDGSIVCVYNGEIYNYKSFGSYGNDGECLIPLYDTMGEKFASLLDGEFAIVIIDFAKDKIIFITDAFATKPLWCASNGKEFAFASYESAVKSCGYLNPIKIPANSVVCLKLSTLEKVKQDNVVKFDTNQHKNHYDDWVNAFLNAVKKRSANTREKVFIGLSGGYDSGAIACASENMSLPYRAYTIPGAENVQVIKQRQQLVSDMHVLDITPEQFSFEREFLKKECEDFYFQGKPAARTDKASAGLSFICRHARDADYKIYLSGQGADEIISDYGWGGRKFYGHSQFGGKFPSDLSAVFPWKSFYEGTQKKYLGKEECVAGSHGIETRYPFLDVRLVQEFLWLKHTLKNDRYKAPLDFFLKKFQFPYTINEKVGFRPNYNF